MPSIDPQLSTAAEKAIASMNAEQIPFFRDLMRVYQRLAQIFNGRISFGWGASLTKENIDGVWVLGNTGAVANADFTLTHNLQRLPVGYIIMQKSAACDIYTGAAAWTTTTLTLRGTVALTDIVLFVV